MLKSIVLVDLSHNGILYRPSPDPSDPTLVALTEIQRKQLRAMGVIGDDIEVADEESGTGEGDLSDEESGTGESKEKPRRSRRSSLPEPPDAA